MKKILITGANGFIGKALCRALIKDGYFVRAALRSPEKFVQCSECQECVSVGDIGPETDWRKALDGIEVVIHAAGRAHVMQETHGHPLYEYRRINVQGTKSLAQQAVAAEVRRIIFLSTIKVNGEETAGRGPYTERDEPKPSDDYALSKWETEQILQKIAEENDLDVLCVRLPLVYGPGVKGNFLRLLEYVYRGKSLPFSLVKNKRSLIYLGNAVSAVTTCVEAEVFEREVFCLSDGEDVSTAQLVQMVAKAMGRLSRLMPVPLVVLRLCGMIGDVIEKISGRELSINGKKIDRLTGSLTVDSGHFRDVTGWEPPYRLADGIKETAAWYLKERK